MKLVIVESPTKAKTIAKFLGKDFKVESSFGHVRDLPKSKLGIEVDKDFAPKYLVPAKARPITNKLKALAKEAEDVILASDEDREGEAIAWHLAEILDLNTSDAKRIVFHEITKDAILHALEHPRHLDKALYDAQQARRVLDRLVGYELSPLLWKKVARGLSAGRVQSVALKLIVDKEQEILAFVPEEYWKIAAKLQAASGPLTADLIGRDQTDFAKLDIKTAEQAAELVADLQQQSFVVSAVNERQGSKKAPTPFKTSVLQQTANRRLGWSAKQTMSVAQKLYEKGYITYMRTDSLNLSDKFLTEAGSYLQAKFGARYTLTEARRFKTKSKGAQEAHEAIRPTDAQAEPKSLAAQLDPRELKLYELIWSRSLASQMPDAILNNSTIDIAAGPYRLAATGQTLVFDGFLKIYSEAIGENELPKVDQGEVLKLDGIDHEQHFTKAPARYSDATLVKELEKNGVGRPSTYAPTISTLEARNYVERTEDKRLKPTDIAFVVIKLLTEHFQEIVDTGFTAKMEKSFDKIAAGKLAWQPVIAGFYWPFHENLVNKEQTLDKKDIMPEQLSEEVCDKCGAKMLIKTGRFGKFLACSNFPECKNTRPFGETAPAADNPALEELKQKYADEKCEKCGEPMIVKTGRFGPFLACSGYPKCKTIKNIGDNKSASIGIKCPACENGELVTKKSRFGLFYACSNYPSCKNAYWGKPTGEHCPKCDALIIEGKKGQACSNKECGWRP